MKNKERKRKKECIRRKPNEITTCHRPQYTQTKLLEKKKKLERNYRLNLPRFYLGLVNFHHLANNCISLHWDKTISIYLISNYLGSSLKVKIKVCRYQVVKQIELSTFLCFNC